MKFSSLKRYICISAIVFSPLPFMAADFYQTLDLLITPSPVIRNLEAQADASKSEMALISNISDPEVEGEYLRGTDGSNRWNVGLSWSLDWPGAYSARNKVKNTFAENQDIQVSVQKRELRLRVASLLIDYIRDSRKLAVFQQLLLCNDSISQIINAGVRDGKLISLDASKINIENGRLKLNILQQENQLASIKSDIISQCGNEASTILEELSLNFPADKNRTKEYYLDRIAETPESKLAQSEILLAKANLNVANAESLPSLTLGYIHAYEENTHFNGGKLGLSLPIFSSKGKKKSADAAIKSAELNYDLQRMQLINSVSFYYDRILELRSAIAELDPVFNTESPQSLLLKAYQLGRISLLDYLLERNYYMEAETDFIDLQAECGQILQTLDSL